MTVERVLGVYPIPSLPTKGLGERHNFPSGSGVEPQPQTIFGRFVRFYACTQVLFLTGPVWKAVNLVSRTVGNPETSHVC